LYSTSNIFGEGRAGKEAQKGGNGSDPPTTWHKPVIVELETAEAKPILRRYGYRDG
jgi:hypothetical protein